MENHITQIKKEIEQSPLSEASELRRFKQRFFGKEGAIAALFGMLSKLTPEEKKKMGPLVNELKAEATDRYEKAQELLTFHKKKSSLQEDYTLPPTYQEGGGVHPITHVQYRIFKILESIGFTVVEGPEVEDEWHNFTALNFPEHHPARDMQDTFFLKQDKKMALRTHTSSVQIRVLEKGTLPVRILSVGRVFRNETISSRSHCVFHQVEGLYVDKGVTFLDLKEVLYYFVNSFFGKGISVRFRPSYFPFTEPSAEVDIACLVCKGKGCSICKQSGWLEIGGAGMVDPNVLKMCKIDSEVYTGYAFGVGLERLAMLLYKIDDVRLFTENHRQFLTQFRGVL